MDDTSKGNNSFGYLWESSKGKYLGKTKFYPSELQIIITIIFDFDCNRNVWLRPNIERAKGSILTLNINLEYFFFISLKCLMGTLLRFEVYISFVIGPWFKKKINKILSNIYCAHIVLKNIY